jgi:SAM-dependent methyltransferase
MGNEMIDLKYATQDKKVFYGIAKDYLKHGHKILDIGAGDASFARYINRKDVYMFDGNANSVEKIKNDFENCYLGRLPNLPFESNFFDLIHCSHVVEHLEPQVLYDTLKEIDRCLKNNGYLIISAPLLWSNFYDDLSHFKPYTPGVFIKYLGENDYSTLTRQKISKNYSIEKLQYRYRETSFTDGFLNTQNNLFLKLLFKFLNLLYRLGLRKYIKNGFTIVLFKKLG